MTDFISTVRSLPQRVTFATPARRSISGNAFAFAYTIFELFVSGWASVFSHRLYIYFFPFNVGFYSNVTASAVGLVLGILYVSFGQQSGAYELRAFTCGRQWLGRLWLNLTCAILLVTAILYIVRASSEISRGTFLFLYPILLILMVGTRAAARSVAAVLVESGRLSGPDVLIIGDRTELAAVDSRCVQSDFGLREAARICFDERVEIDDAFVDEALSSARLNRAAKIVVLMRWDDRSRLKTLRLGLRRSPLPVSLLPDASVRELIDAESKMSFERRQPVIELQSAPMTPLALAAKRAFDIVFSALALLILFPLMLLIAVAIRADSAGPIIFKQRRHGFDRRPFDIYKFRSMTVTEDSHEIRQACPSDTRVTRIGRAIRKTSIDELPQLINVLKGDMSLVGPRPHAIAHDEEYSALVERYSFRHHVKPGLTGWAQINGARGRTERVKQMQARIDMDLWYIDHASLWLDLMILSRTCVEVLKLEAF